MGKRKPPSSEEPAQEAEPAKKETITFVLTAGELHELALAIDKNRSETMRVNRRALNRLSADVEALERALTKEWHPPYGLITTEPRANSTTVEVDAKKLDALMIRLSRGAAKAHQYRIQMIEPEDK